jgi:hypothetical protein
MMTLSPKPFPSKDKGIMLDAIKKRDMGLLMSCSRSRLLYFAHNRLHVMRQAAEIKAPLLPLDGAGEVIDYPAGRGRGKIAIVEWLIDYEQRYQEMNSKLILDERINQSLLN